MSVASSSSDARPRPDPRGPLTHAAFCLVAAHCTRASRLALGSTNRAMRALLRRYLDERGLLPALWRLTPSQYAAAVEVLVRDRSMCLMGEAGAGKSYLFRALIAERQRAGHLVLCAAPSGIAATPLGGQTVHSLFGLSVEHRASARGPGLKANCKYAGALRRARTIFIDEMSMMSEEMIALVDARLRRLRDPNAPFGGAQLVLTGDFSQLPPVPGSTPASRRYCFEAPVFRQAFVAPGLVRTLAGSRRHEGDAQFAAMLNQIRRGELSRLARIAFAAQVVSSDAPPDTSATTYLYCTRDRTLAHNERCLTALPTADHTWRCIDMGEDAESLAAAKRIDTMEETLRLRVGAPVLLRSNLTDTLVNGTRGTVIAVRTVCQLGLGRCHEDAHCEACHPACNPDWTPAPRCYAEAAGGASLAVLQRFGVSASAFNLRPVVQFVGEPAPLVVAPFLATIKAPGAPAGRRVRPDADDSAPAAAAELADGRVVAARLQFPLCLAFALTIHKAQGMTLDRVCLPDINRSFAPGQVYVALSRVRHIRDLVFLDAEPRRILCAAEVARFYAEVAPG